ncbi:mitochondrial 2-oxoglutarate/malate carrier protein-like [Daktulosphaira vitifoliae]|uniref:mitochondrial 2-oxoglutarate/malate carrier protein-like n=1 Tax=Daktulosphaira vitifoliae TaxID=58002 RepID=UPI0021AA45A4|nr:mitochondrial 2-oxoglutarate/malate carrier protein-like [Daktulosphaira vitifoliae]XP_050537076.1 mitochondrial 2-oxoglutarate/malate carrier protein-like [Daktulosphaira vitifoliae]XP_050537077.1 mitochondrial 2-oxoglutarate/malate carrier protein-like [Daktulosphaira vitifoliae]
MSDSVPIPSFIKFVNGGISATVATVIVHPLDVLKNRMQMAGRDISVTESQKSMGYIVRSMIKEKGVSAFYPGLSAGILRQATYSSTRLGLYNTLFTVTSGKDNKPPGLPVKLGIAMISGVVGAAIGTPAEVALIRMTSDAQLPIADRRGYTSVFNALARIAREEGIATWWRGCIATMGRAAVVNMAQLASYSQSKEMYLKTGYFEDNIVLHFASSMTSGAITTIASLPVDIAKTRIQSMKIINGVPEYSGTVNAMVKVVKNEGFFNLWKGIVPYFARIGPHTVLTFIFLEQINQAYKIVAFQNSSKN